MERDGLERKEAAAGYTNHLDVPIGHWTRSQWGRLALGHNSTLTLTLLKSFPKDLLKIETAAHRVTFVWGKWGFTANTVPESHFLHTTH